jgi:hypothetical protein
METISLSELLTNLHAVQAGMGAKNTHRSIIRTAMMALIGQAEQIAVLRQGVEAAAAGAIPPCADDRLGSNPLFTPINLYPPSPIFSRWIGEGVDITPPMLTPSIRGYPSWDVKPSSTLC